MDIGYTPVVWLYIELPHAAIIALHTNILQTLFYARFIPCTISFFTTSKIEHKFNHIAIT